MIFNPFWITLTELLVVPGMSSTSPISAPDIYIYIYMKEKDSLENQIDISSKVKLVTVVEGDQKAPFK